MSSALTLTLLNTACSRFNINKYRQLKNKRPTWWYLLFYFTSYVLKMFRTLIYPSSGACDYSVKLPHLSHCSWFDVCWSSGVVGLQASACNTDITPTQPHRNSNTHRTKNNTTNVVIQQNIRELLMMDILMSETCWAHKKWNKIGSDIKLVFYSSTITMMYGPINIRKKNTILIWLPLVLAALHLNACKVPSKLQLCVMPLVVNVVVCSTVSLDFKLLVFVVPLI